MDECNGVPISFTKRAFKSSSFQLECFGPITLTKNCTLVLKYSKIDGQCTFCIKNM